MGGGPLRPSYDSPELLLLPRSGLEGRFPGWGVWKSVKTTQMRTHRDSLLRARSGEGVSHHHSRLVDAKRPAGQWESLAVNESEGFTWVRWEDVGIERLKAGLLGGSSQPVQVQCVKQVLKASALGQPRGMGCQQRWGTGRGDTCTPMADSCQCGTKTTTIL